ncbi:hypothetical protein BB559_006193 [Furculomyces boomerangus]|uniref:TOG domain-containing protein n=1 Tax=Furculomyces boomerangus TaxID=61424 RepID=A0A2T9Y4G4_9FUNG|nr:hypothetical protein BB559_006193 [Furculomyces boomerangus]
MADPQDYSSLPLIDRISHKVWKVRVQAYTEAEKIFATLDPDTESSTFDTYEPLLKKIVIDSNVAAQESGIGAVIKWVDNSPNPTRSRDDVVGGVVEKCLGSTRASIKSKGLELLLLYCEIDTPGPVLDKVITGFQLKQPKSVLANVQVAREIIESFGTKHINIKTTAKSIVIPLGNKDSNIRSEGKKLAVELYRWVGPALKSFLTDLDGVLQRELEADFEKLPKEKPIPTRLLRSEMVKEQGSDEMNLDQEPEDVPMAQESTDNDMDPWDLAEPVNILDKIPSDFSKNISSTNWKERKESLEKLTELLTPIRLAEGNYGDLVTSLSKRISDTNVLVVVLAANSIEKLALSLKNSFASYQTIVTTPIIERLKERKANVISALHNTLLAVFQSTNCQIPDFISSIASGLSHKNPQTRSETLKFFTACIKTTLTRPAKGQIKEYFTMIKSLESDSDPSVRDSVLETIGALMKLVGEKALAPFLEGMDKKKEAKIKEYFESATIKAPPLMSTTLPQSRSVANAKPKPLASKQQTNPINPKKAENKNAPLSPNTLPTKAPPVIEDTESKKPNPNIPQALLKRLEASTKQAAEKKLARAQKSQSSNPQNNTKIESNIQPITEQIEQEPPRSPVISAKVQGPSSTELPKINSSWLPADDTPIYKYSSNSDLDGLLENIIPNHIKKSIESAKWKDRVDAINSLLEHFVSEQEIATTLEPELVVRQLGKKPGWKESNFQVNTGVYNLIKWMSLSCAKFNSGVAALTIPHLVEKLGDIKLKTPASNALIAMGERLGLRFIIFHAIEPISKQKSPKVLAECFGWLDQVLLEFGTTRITLKPLIDFIKTTGLSSNNAQVRSKAIGLMGTLYRYIGPSLKGLLGELNPQLMQLLEDEFNKATDQPPPLPIRAQPGASQGSSTSKENNSSNKNANKGPGSEDMMDELFPRVDLSQKASPALIKKLSDANWKVRKEALDSLSQLIEQANKRIQPGLSNELFGALKGRLNDSNKNLIAQTLGLLALFSESMGPPFERYLRIVGLPTMQCLSDKKLNVRQAAIKALESYLVGGLKAIDDLISLAPGALAQNSPELRKDLLFWINDTLSKLEKEEGIETIYQISSIGGLTSVMFSCLQDRNSDVRKNAMLVTAYVIKSVGFNEVKDSCSSQLGGAALQTVLSILNQLQPSQPTGPSISATRTDSSRVPGSPTSSYSQFNSNTQNFHTDPQSTGNQPAASQRSGLLRRPMTVKRRGVVSTGDRISSPQGKPLAQSLSGSSQGNPDFEIMEPVRQIKSSDTTNTLQHPITSGDTKQKELRSRKEAATSASARWSFSEFPKQELINLLQDQMNSLFSNELMTNLFSQGHYKDRDYLVGMTSLDDVLSSHDIIYERYGITEEQNTYRVLATSDLIIKYISIRLYDTQTNSVLKCLELAEHLIDLFVKTNTQFSDYEANLLIPHLVLRLGDAKETIRSRVRAMVTSKLLSIYPPSKIFSVIVESGAKNPKNARTRQESLDSLTYLLTKRTGGMGIVSICINPPKTVSLVAQLIRDRDANVRTAALNCLVAFCSQLPGGEPELWNMIGSLPEKERAMLGEKIKRSDVGTKTANMSSIGRVSPSVNKFKRASALPPTSRIRPPLQVASGLQKTPTLSRTSRTPSSLLQELNLHKGIRKTYSNESEDSNFSSFGIENKPGEENVVLPTFSTQQNTSAGYRKAVSSNSASMEIKGLNNLNNTFVPVPLLSPRNQQSLFFSGNSDENSDNSFKPILEQIIADLKSPELELKHNSLENLNNTLSSFVNSNRRPEHQMICNFVDDILIGLSETLSKVFVSRNLYKNITTNTQELIRTNCLKCMQVVFSDIKWAASVGENGLSVIFDCLVSCMSELMPKDGSYVRVINSLLSDIIRTCNSTTTIVVVLDIFNNVNYTPLKLPLVSNEHQSKRKYIDITQRCLWRIEKKVCQDINQLINLIDSNYEMYKTAQSGVLQVDQVFLAVQKFFESIPEEEWLNRQDESIFAFGTEPMRSAKSLLHSLVSSLESRSWLFIGSIISHLVEQKSFSIPMSVKVRLNETDRSTAATRDYNFMLSELVNLSVVINYIAKYMQSTPSFEQWKCILDFAREENDSKDDMRTGMDIDLVGSNFETKLLVSPRKTLGSGSSSGTFLNNLQFQNSSSPTLKSNATSHINPVSSTNSNTFRRSLMNYETSSMSSKTFEQLQIELSGNQKLSKDNRPRSLYPNFKSETEMFSDSIGGVSNLTSDNKKESSAKLQELNPEATGNGVDTKLNDKRSNGYEPPTKETGSGFDIRRFPIGMNLLQKPSLELSGASESSQTSSDNISENNRGGKSSTLSGGFNGRNFGGTSFSNRPNSMAFDNQLKDLKDRLDKMRRERLG